MIRMSDFIPYGRHVIDQEDIKAVEEVLRGDWLTSGSTVDAFEEKIREISNSPYAISCSNGTTALHLALKALGIGPGDQVIVPAVTFLASANAARFVGADVIFADVDPKSGLLTAQTLEAAINTQKDSSKIKAVVNVHLNGQCEDLEAIQQVAKKHNLFIVEDAAHAVGTVYVNHQGERYPIGANQYCDLTTFSFHPVKTIATGEGGAVTCKSPEMAKRLKTLRTHGMIRDNDGWENAEQGFDANGNANPWYYEMHEIGYNYRISDINCALGLSQLQKLDQFKAKRKDLVEHYDASFKGIPYLSTLTRHPFSDTAWHLYVVKINFNEIGKSRAEVMNALKDKGIGTQVHYMPLYRHPYYQRLYGSQKLSGAEAYYERCLSIPLYTGLTSEQQNHIIGKIKNIRGN